MYADNPYVEFIGIEKQGPSGSVQSWIDSYGWTFPVGINDTENRIYQMYENSEFAYDRVYVIGPDRKITFEDARISTADFPRIDQAIISTLDLVPTVPLTWGRLKSIYR